MVTEQQVSIDEVLEGNIAVDQAVGHLFALKHATDAWQVRLVIPQGACLCGGLSESALVRAARPWRERREEMRRLAVAVSAATLPAQDGKEGDEPLITVFRRDPRDGALCIAGNQVRTMLQETARALFEGDPGYRRLQYGLHRNLRVEPTIIPLWRQGEDGRWRKVTKPDGILELPRQVRKPPYERSVVQRPEYVRGPLQLRMLLVAKRVGAGESLTDEVLLYLMEYAGVYVKLGAHRGLEDTPAGEPGRFEIESWQHHRLEPPPPPTLSASSRKRRGKAAPAEGEAA